MCLSDISKKEEKKVLAKLPDPFPFWKIVQKNGHCEFDNNVVGPHITERGQYEAEDHPAFRLPITYEPGYHGYIKMPVIRDAYPEHKVRKF